KASDEERKAGFDLADYLVRFSLSEFTGKPQPETGGPTVGAGTDKCYPSYVNDSLNDHGTIIDQSVNVSKHHPFYVSDTGITFTRLGPGHDSSEPDADEVYLCHLSKLNTDLIVHSRSLNLDSGHSKPLHQSRNG
ncbi:MAG: hypothetical protein LBU44_03715, partial [Mediterranea sp.]|nr:hypothetical protein [Mediterranea sp.]